MEGQRIQNEANTPSGVIVDYLLREVPEFRKLSELRQQVKSKPVLSNSTLN